MTLTNGRTTAYQWDYGLKVGTTDAIGTKVRFANEHGSRSIVVEAVSEGMSTVYHIPDILLTTGRAIVMYHLGGDGETSVYTTTEDFLPVYEAPKPDDYIFTEEEIRTWKELDERLTEAEGDIVALESGKADVVHTHTESDITDLKDYIVEPTSDGTNGQVLTTNGSGGRSWASIPTEVLRVVFTQSGSTVTADQTYDTIYAAASAGKDVFGLLNGKVFYFGGVSSGPVLEFYAQDIFTASTGEIKVTTRNLGMNSGSSVVYTETERLFAPKEHTHSDYVPTTRTVNNKALSADITLSNTDVGAAATAHTHQFSAIEDRFVATYDSTDWDDVDEAYAAGYTMLCRYQAVEAPLSIATGSAYVFSFISHDTSDDSDSLVSLILTGTGWSSVTNPVSGGSGGTSDYTELSNKPQINSVTLSGNKSSSDLGLADAVHTHSQYLTQETDPTVPSWAKASTKPTYTAAEVGAIPVSPTGLGDFLRWDQSAGQWVKSDISASDVGAMPNPHSDYSPSDGEVIVYNGTQGRWDVVSPEDSGLIPSPSSPSAGDVLTYVNGEWSAQTPSSGTTDYTDLTNKPSINNVTLSGNKTTSDLGISLTGLSDVFIATYNTTTIADLDAARTAGKKIFLGTSDGVLRPLCEYSWSPKIYSFISGEGDGETISITSCKETGNTTVWSNYRHSYLWANTLIGPPNDGEVLTYNSSSDTWMAMPLPESADPYVITLDGSTGLPTDEINDVLNAYNNGRILVVTNGSDYWYSRYVADGASEFYMIASYASGNSTSTLTLTYDYTDEEWSLDIDDWSFVPTSRTVNNKALSSNITLTSSDVGAIPAPSSPTSGQFLSWNGSAWVATSLPVWNGGVT